MAATIALASCPASRGTGVSTFGFAAWHPEHDAAPGGTSAAGTGVMPAQSSMPETTARRAFIPGHSQNSAGGGFPKCRTAANLAAVLVRSNKGQTLVLQRE